MQLLKFKKMENKDKLLLNSTELTGILGKNEMDTQKKSVWLDALVL